MTTKEFKIGLSGIAAIAILYLGINFLKGVSMTGGQNRYYVAFDNVRGLAVSSPVYAGGYKVGIVHDIRFDYEHNGKVIVVVDVDPELRIPVQSTASLESAMLGGCTMNLVLAASNTTYLAPGDTIQGSNESGLMTQAAELMPDVGQVISHIDQLVLNLDRLVTDSSLNASLHNVETLTASLNSSSQHLDNLLANHIPQTLSSIEETAQHATQLTDQLAALELERTLSNLDSTVLALQQTIGRLNSTDNNLGLLLNDTAMYANLNSTLNSATMLLDDLRQHPKRYVHFSLFGRKQ